MYISGGGKEGGKGGCGGGGRTCCVRGQAAGAGDWDGGWDWDGVGQKRMRKSRAFGQAPERAMSTVNRPKLAF